MEFEGFDSVLDNTLFIRLGDSYDSSVDGGSSPARVLSLERYNLPSVDEVISYGRLVREKINDSSDSLLEPTNSYEALQMKMSDELFEECDGADFHKFVLRERVVFPERRQHLGISYGTIPFAKIPVLYQKSAMASRIKVIDEVDRLLVDDEDLGITLSLVEGALPKREGINFLVTEGVYSSNSFMASRTYNSEEMLQFVDMIYRGLKNKKIVSMVVHRPDELTLPNISYQAVARFLEHLGYEIVQKKPGVSGKSDLSFTN